MTSCSSAVSVQTPRSEEPSNGLRSQSREGRECGPAWRYKDYLLAIESTGPEVTMAFVIQKRANSGPSRGAFFFIGHLKNGYLGVENC